MTTQEYPLYTRSHVELAMLRAIELAVIQSRFKHRLPQTTTVAVRPAIFDQVNAMIPDMSYPQQQIHGIAWLAERGIKIVAADVALDLPATEYVPEVSSCLVTRLATDLAHRGGGIA